MSQLYAPTKRRLLPVVYTILAILLLLTPTLVFGQGIPDTHTYQFFNEGTFVRTQIVQNGEILYEPPTPTAPPGKIFDGWKIAGVPVTFGTQTVTSTQTFRVDAAFKDGYYVRFIYTINGVDQTLMTKSVTPGTTTDASGVSYVIANADETFSHWSTTPGGSTPFDFTGTPINQATTLYLVTKPAVTVRFDSQGGSYVDTQYLNIGDQAQQPLSPTREGYTFRHWATAPNGNTAYNWSLPVNTSMVLYAVWDPKTVKYKVSYYLENAENDKYTFIEAKEFTGVVGTTPNFAESFWNNATNFINADPAAIDDYDVEKKRYEYDHVVFDSPEDEADYPGINPDESSVLRVYFNRKRYVFTMMYCINTKQTNCQPTSNYHVLAKATYKYGQSTEPTYSIGQNHPTYGNYSWAIGMNQNQWYSAAPEMKAEDVTVWGRWGGTRVWKIHYQENFFSNYNETNNCFFSLGIPIRPDDTIFYSGGLNFTREDGIAIEGFQIFLKDGEADSPSNANSSHPVVARWEPLSGAQTCKNPNTGATVTIDPRTDNGTIFYRRLSYNVNFYRNNADGLFTVPEKILFEGDLSFLETKYAADLTLADKVEGGVTYQFDGWYDNTALQGDPFVLAGESMPPRDLALYAKWVPKPIEVRYCRTIEGTQCARTTVTPDHTLSAAQVLAIENYKTVPAGYTAADFKGWYRKTPEGTLIPFDLATEPIPANFTLYPYYSGNPFTVTYQLGSGTGTVPVDPGRYAFDSMAVLLPPTDVIPPTNYEFCGWKDQADATNTTYYPGDSIRITENKTMIASYCPAPRNTTVTYRKGAGATGDPDLTLTFPENSRHTLYDVGSGGTPASQVNFTRPGYSFTGWLRDNGTVYAPGTEVFLLNLGAVAGQNNVFTAQWSRDVTSVTARKTWNGGPQSSWIPVDLTLIRLVDGVREAWTAPAPTISPAAGPSQNYDYTWTNLETHNPSGKLYEYQVIENLTPEQSALTDPVITPDPANAYHWTVTNNYKSPTIDVEVTKAWQGGFYLDKPDIPIRLVGTCQVPGGTACTPVERTALIGMSPDPSVSPVEQELDATNFRENWKYTFTGLPKYDLSGEEYKYQIVENWAPGDKPAEWSSDCSTVAANGTERLTCVNTYDPPLIPIDPGSDPNDPQTPGHVTGTKHWLGGARTGYADVTLQLWRQWKENLDADCAPGTNACGQQERAKIKAPGNPNAEEKVLVASTECPPDPTNPATPCATDWKTTWTQIPERDQQTGYPFHYYMIETAVGAIQSSTPPMGAFVQVIEDPDTTPLEVSNRYVPPLVNEGDPDPTTNDGEVKGTKFWNGGTLADHTQVTLRLTRQWKQKPNEECGPTNECGTEEIHFTPRDSTTPITDLVITAAEAKLSNSQTKVWVGLAWREFDNGYLYVYSVSELESDDDLAPYKQVADTEPLTVTNQYQSGTTSIRATKNWIGGDPAARPSFTFQLCRTTGTDFSGCGDAAALGTITYPDPFVWDNVATHDANGKPYKYWVIETVVPTNYTPVNRNLGASTEEERLTITNEYKSPDLPNGIVGEVKWHGDGGATTHRRDTSMQLFRTTGTPDANGNCPTDGTAVGVPVTIPAAGFTGGDYTVTFAGPLPEFDANAQRYCYYVDIVDSGGPIQIVGSPTQVHYQKVVSATDSTALSENNDLVVDLRLTQPNIKVEVTKTWEGGQNYSPKPTGIYFQLQRCIRDNVTATECSSGSTPANVDGHRTLWANQKITWYGLPSEDASGNSYLYSVIEVNADGSPWTHDYYTPIYGTVNLSNSMTQALAVTNRFHGKKIGDIVGTLEWIPNNDNLKSIVTIQLCRYKEGSPSNRECTGDPSHPLGTQTSKTTTLVSDTSVVWPEHADLVDRAPDGTKYVYLTVHDGPNYDGNSMVYQVDPKDSNRPLHLVYRYVPRTIKIQVTKTWTNKGQLVRTPVEVTLYGGSAGANQPVPASALSNELSGVVDPECVMTNPMVITPTATAIGDAADHTVVRYWCVPADNENAVPYTYTAKETKVNYIFWEPTQPTNEVSGHSDANATLNNAGNFAVGNKFNPPLINYEDNDPDCPPNSTSCTHDTNGDDGKMTLTKKWVGGINFRVPVDINLLRNEDQNPGNTNFEDPDPAVSPKRLSGNPNQDTWSQEFTNIPGMSADGEKYVYKIAENNVPVGFNNPPSSPVIDQQTRTVTNKYQVPTGTVNITVTIEDGNPSSIGTDVQLVCKYNGQVVWTLNPAKTFSGFSGTNCTSTATGQVCSITEPIANVPMVDENGNPLQCEIDQKDIPGYEKIPGDPGPKPFPPNGTIELGINYKYKSDTDNITGTKRWVDGEADGPRPTVYFQLWRKIGASGTPEVVPGAAVKELMDGTLTVEWADIDLNSPLAERYTFIIKEVSDISGASAWVNPKYTVTDMTGLTVTNKYKIPLGPITGKKIWRYKLPTEPIPTVNLKLFRRIPPSGAWQEVPGQAVKELLAGASPYEVVWNDVEQTNSAGKSYEFLVREVDPLGNDFVPDGYAKIEEGAEVVNERLGRLFVWVTPVPASHDAFEIIGTNDDMSSPHSQIVDNNDTDPTYPKRFQWDNVKKARTAFWLDQLDPEKWDVTGIECKSRPYGADESTDGTDFSVQAKRSFTGRMTGEFSIQEMPTGRDVYCEIKLANLLAAKIIVRNVTVLIPGKTIDPLDYTTTGLGLAPFTMTANGPENVQEVSPGEFTLKQTKNGPDWAEWDTIDVTISSSIVRRNPLISLTNPAFEQDTELRFNVVDHETVVITFYNVPKNTIMLKKITNPSNVSDRFEFAGVLAGHIRHNEVLMRQMTPDGKYNQAIEVPQDGWTKHSLWCVERGPAGYVNNLVTRTEFYTMSAWYGLDEGETILCTFANRAIGEEDFPDIPDPDIPGFTDFLPRTGFAPGRVTAIAEQPVSKLYQSSNLKLTIPKLGQSLEIVGIPQTSKGWDVSWLSNNAGYLMGTTFPTWEGNSVITAHVWDAYNNPGPFAGLKNLEYGDRFEIEAYGKTYVYEVRESEQVRAGEVDRVVKQGGISNNMVTLLTCEAYDEAADKYEYRRLVRAVLVDTK